MKNLEYQQKAITELVDKSIRLLTLNGDRHKLVFEAPTGSGKTVMAGMMLERLEEELTGRDDVNFSELAMIWIAPNKLHEQSYGKIKGFFSETRVVKPVMYDELSDRVLQPHEVLFVNWESINKEKNLMVREDENHRSLYEIVENTKRERNVPVVVIIDEEHLFWNKTADKSGQVLKRINPKLEIRISATPKTKIGGGDDIVKVFREDVVKEEMIKEGVILNPAITKGYNNEQTLNQHLIELAMKKREEIKRGYEDLGININPLLLIQLPNDNKESLNADEELLIETVETYLKFRGEGCTIKNERLAVWLSGRRDNLRGIEEMDSMVDVLLFKQAIALGWDCPRAAVLLIFRKLESYTFTVQTVGRILRMPEQKFYPNDLLNKGYVYTDLSADKIEIVADDMDYMSQIVAKRRTDLQNVSLKSVYQEYTSGERNRLGSDFKGLLRSMFSEKWKLKEQTLSFDENGQFDELGFSGELDVATNRDKAEAVAGIAFDIKAIMAEIPDEVVLNLDSETDLRSHKAKFGKSYTELRKIYWKFCNDLLGGFEKAHSTDVLARYLTEVMEDLFGLEEFNAMLVIMSPKNSNKTKFMGVIDAALKSYAKRIVERQVKAKERSYKEVDWEVPEDRMYNEQSNEADDEVENHAMMPFVRSKIASNPERRFEKYLEENSAYIDWWYKNGDEGRQHYAIEYEREDKSKGLFYVDFVIRMKSGIVYLFDTKTLDSDMDAVAKHNALITYMERPENVEKHLKGGIMIEENGLWKYSPMRIETMDTNGWEAFIPE